MFFETESQNFSNSQIYQTCILYSGVKPCDSIRFFHSFWSQQDSQRGAGDGGALLMDKVKEMGVFC